MLGISNVTEGLIICNIYHKVNVCFLFVGFPDEMHRTHCRVSRSYKEDVIISNIYGESLHKMRVFFTLLL
jgi:hypothetical protein